METKIWTSFVWHKDKCFLVSTIKRTFNVLCGECTRIETIAWKFNLAKAKLGIRIGQAAGACDHQRICKCLIATGVFPDENNPKHERFFE